MDRNFPLDAIVTTLQVAPREGGVDRNLGHNIGGPSDLVAPREGGVDRNLTDRTWLRHWAVAPREGGVDRNTRALRSSRTRLMSPPARGAWIAT